MPSSNLSQNQRVKLYPKMQKLWAEVCSNCQKTLEECNLEPFDKLTGTGGFEIHHTRYDLGMTNENITRFMCHSCNHKSELRRK